MRRLETRCQNYKETEFEEMYLVTYHHCGFQRKPSSVPTEHAFEALPQEARATPSKVDLLPTLMSSRSHCPRS